MDVRVKIGRYAGEIQDIPAPEAKLMLADGRAEDPYAEPAEQAIDAPIEPQALPAKPKKNKR